MEDGILLIDDDFECEKFTGVPSLVLILNWVCFLIGDVIGFSGNTGCGCIG